MGSKHQVIRALLTDAIIDLCRREAFYLEELRIEGTLCLVSDRSSVLIAQITEQIGEKPSGSDPCHSVLNYEGESTGVNQNETESETSKKRKFPDGGFSDDVQSQVRPIDDAKQEVINESLKSETKDGKYKCPFCPKVYGFKHNLKDHINKHTGRKPHVCKYCGMTFTFLASMCGHIKRRHFHCMPRDHQCTVCGNRFPNKQSLHQHMTWRHSPKKTAGVAARKTGSNQQKTSGPRQRKNSSPRHHQESALDDVKINIEGDIVEEDEEDEGSQVQVKEESMERSVVPAACLSENAGPEEGGDEEINTSAFPTEDMDLSQLQALSMTIPKLSDNSPGPGLMGLPLPLLPTSMGFPMFPPPLPLFSLPSPSNNTQRAAVSSPKLTDGSQHNPTPELYRSANGKFQCPYCEKSYRFKHTLKDHINTHFGKRPHVCKYCGDAFTHFASLCAHIKRRHKEHIPKDFACTICNENFMNLQSLKQHFTWRHKDKQPEGVPVYQGQSMSSRRLSGTPDLTSSPSATSTSASPRQSPNKPQLSPTSVTSPTLPSMEAFIKSGGLALPGFPHQNLIAEQMLRDMKDFAGPLGFDPPGVPFSPPPFMGGFNPQSLLSPQGLGQPFNRQKPE